MENKFKLSHVVLYSKGWYLITENIIEDLLKILELDNYSPFDLNDVYHILITNVQNSNIYRWSELKEVLEGISPKNVWKYGYKYKEYDVRIAFIHYTLSNLRMLDNQQWNIVTPKVTKYPRGKNITVKKLTEQFAKHV